MVYILLQERLSRREAFYVMKKKSSKSKSKKKVTFWNKLSLKLTELKDWVLFNWDDEDLLFGGGLTLVGLGLVLGWLNPIAWLGYSLMGWGVLKMYKVLR
jgi:hypothetical protein